ncbi:MAG TPA: molecular chaperone TorD family protein [Burkholderiales bacterium]|jgi:TorA maturation chaperone TorD|nr:molecular chaperone TorD family protein [Burkholderiales bacterium]
MSLPPEEEGRANFYALLARLFYAPADAGLLAALAQADEFDADDEIIAARWREMAKAASSADPAAVREEYETAFIGTGKAPITLYTSAYSIKYTNETPLVALRGELATLGLVRRNEAGEPEDHIAALCDTMRYLVSERELSEQQRFFARWIQPIAEPLCNAIEESQHTVFYKSIGRLAKAFFSLEHSAFEML